MATDMERLIVSLEARTKAFENALIKANTTAQKQLRNIEKKFADTNKKLELKPQSGGGFGGFGGFGKVAGVALAAREVQKYADAWTEAGNKIAAASQISGRQARSLSELNRIATTTRSGITETVDLYSKLLMATKDVAKSEEEVARATEIVNKSFKAGGQSAAAQASGILQLGQALGSGVLQGDELRSLRESAPVLLQSIAKEFGVTIAGLKDLGAEGQLTSDRVFKAILAGAPQIEKAFSSTNATIGDSFTLLGNSLSELAGKFNDATGVGGSVSKFVGEDLVGAISQLSDALDKISKGGGGDFLERIATALATIQKLANDIGKAAGDATGLSSVGPALGLGGSSSTISSFLSGMEGLVKAYDQIEALNGAFDEFRGSIQEMKPEAVQAFDELQKQLNKGTIDADAARVAIDALFGDDPMFGRIKTRFEPLLNALKSVEAEAKAARDSLAAMNGDGSMNGAGYGRGNGAAEVEARKEKRFLEDRNADAKRTEIQKDIDTRADAILKAAEKIGVTMTEAAAKIQAKGEIAAETAAKSSAASASSAMDLIKKFEGFIAKPKYDVNALRVGYGSDTVTLDDGSVKKVTQGITVSLEGATRDLARRIEEFQTGIKSDIGSDTFNSFSEEQQAVLTSIAYNYGSLPDRIIEAIKNGTTADVYAAIKGLGSDNGGINRGRRNSEAEMFIGDAPAGIKKGIDSQEDFAKRMEEQRQYIAALQAETGIRATLNPLVNDYGLAMSTVQAAQQLLTEAQKEGTAAGLELTDVQQLLYGDLSRLSPAALAQAMAMRELATQTGQAEAAGERLSVSQEKLSEKLQESSALGKDVLGGFIRDLRDGKSATEALAGALDKVADKLLDMALNSLFDGGGGSGSGGGILGGLFAGIGSIFGFKDGGVAARGKPLKRFAGGGVSKTAAIFGEAGPEAAVPLPDGRRIPVDLRTSGIPNKGGGQETINVVLQDDSGRMAEIADQRIQTSSGTIVRVAVQQSRKAIKGDMPGLMANAQARSL